MCSKLTSVHFSSKSQAFCFSYIPFMSSESGIAIQDNRQHQLEVFKYEPKSERPGTPWYITKPPKPQAKDRVILGTMLCSTKLTQDPRLLGLLVWREARNAGAVVLYNSCVHASSIVLY
eukprot:m.276551 g.276551  ORF g.276551 m.276551 type:complete len:119 (-) comp17699_c0_seq2:3490-3846(-)